MGYISGSWEMGICEVSRRAFAAAHANGATVIDVRDLDDDVMRHVVGAVLMPMGQLPSRTGELNHRLPLIVVCATGNRSSALVDDLASAGFDTNSVAGGTAASSRSRRSDITGDPRHGTTPHQPRARRPW